MKSNDDQKELTRETIDKDLIGKDPRAWDKWREMMDELFFVEDQNAANKKSKPSFVDTLKMSSDNPTYKIYDETFGGWFYRGNFTVEYPK